MPSAQINLTPDSTFADYGNVHGIVQNQILRVLTPTTSIMEAKIDQCSAGNSNRARFRLLVTESPAPGVYLRFLDFRVAPDGTVSDVRFN